MAGEDDSDIPETGAVFTFGKSKFAENLPNKFWVRNDKVLQVACGDEHTCLVAESGRVFTFGSNDWGQLGLGNTSTANRPSCIKSLKHEKVTLVACGRVHTIVATESGKLYSFGANGEGQLGVDKSDSKQPVCIDTLPPTQYKMLTAGADHSLALTMDGRVFVWGGGSEGQLGLGETTEAPEPTELFMDEDIECVACGYYHTALVTSTGKLYTFGEKDSGKLGLGNDVNDTSVPQFVDLPEKATRVACGGSHTVVLTKGGSVYTFGDGSNGQLGHGTTLLEVSVPERLKFNATVSKMSCGENHTALVSRKGQLFTFGDGRHGKLALGTEGFSNQFIPAKVERFSKFYINEVSCGGCHMIALATLKMENGYIESSESEVEEEVSKTKSFNHTLKIDNSLDLSISARERRRQHSSPLPLHRTLPELANNKPLPPLGSSLPKTLDHATLKPIQTPVSQDIKNDSISRVSESSETESDEEEMKNKSVNHVLQGEENSENASPKPAPRPLPRHGKAGKQEDEHSKNSESEEDETLDKIQTFTPEDDKLNKTHDAAEKLKTKGEELNKDSESDDEDEAPAKMQQFTPEDDSNKLNKMQDEVEKLKTKEGISGDDSDEELEEKEEESAMKLPVPQPRKAKSSTDEEEKLEQENDVKKDKKKVKRKEKKATIFGKTTTSLSGEDDDETEDDDDETEDESEKEEKGDKKMEEVKEEKEEEQELKEKEMEENGDKGKKPKKEKKSKKDKKKKDKKDKKKDKAKLDDEKKDKKDKKKDKDKKKTDAEKSEKEEKIKDETKNKEEKENNDGEKVESTDTKKGKKEEKTDKKAPKKSRTCTVL